MTNKHLTNNIIIKAVGKFLPKNIVSNAQLSEKIDTSDEWIFSRTGIRQRHLADVFDGENVAYMAFKAALDALKKADISSEDIGLIIVATSTANKIFPSVATQVAGLLGCNLDVASFDLQAACTGFIPAYVMANNMMECNAEIKYALVIGAEKMSDIVNWQDRSTCVLFGDGAGAVVLARNQDACNLSGGNNCFVGENADLGIKITSENADLGIKITSECGGLSKDISVGLSRENQGECSGLSGGQAAALDRGMIDYKMGSNGKLVDILYANNKEEGIVMNGKEVFITATQKLAAVVIDLCRRNNMEVGQIDHFLFHQANQRILKSLVQNLKIDQDKVHSVIDLYANTSAASIPLLLDYHFHKIHPGQKVLLAAIGGGMTWGGVLLNF